MPHAGSGLLQAQQSQQSHNSHTALIGFALTVRWTAVASPSEGHGPDCKEGMGAELCLTLDLSVADCLLQAQGRLVQCGAHGCSSGAGPPAAPIPQQAAAAHHVPAAQGAQAPLPQQHAAAAGHQQVCASKAWPVLQIWQPAQAARLHQTEALAVALCVVKCDGVVLRSACCCYMPAVKCLYPEAAYLTGI